MKNTCILFITLVLTSCIPYKIAPKFTAKDYKVMSAKKFQKTLPRDIAFIFKDPKEANEFYQYVNKKYNLNDNDVGVNTAFQLNGETYYLSYSEVSIADKNYNLALSLTDAVLEDKTGYKISEGNYVSRQGHWYIAITVYDEDIKNCLQDTHPIKSDMIDYLKTLKSEYLSTSNYEALLFTKKS